MGSVFPQSFVSRKKGNEIHVPALKSYNKILLKNVNEHNFANELKLRLKLDE